MNGAQHALKARYTITPLDAGQRTVAIVAEQRVADASTHFELIVPRTLMLGAAWRKMDASDSASHRTRCRGSKT